MIPTNEEQKEDTGRPQGSPLQVDVGAGLAPALISSAQEIEVRRQAVRENAKRVLRESGLADMLRAINKDQLKGRGKFEEYDSIVLFKWGTGYTRRHIWVEVRGNTIRFRLTQHRQCTALVPLCDGEYHTFTSTMWADRNLLYSELQKYYAKPVAESSDD